MEFMSAYKYGFVNAKIGAMRSQLLDNLEMKTLIESRNLDDTIALLKNTSYGKELSSVSSPSIVDIENALLQSTRSAYEKISKAVNGMPKDLLDFYTKKFEIEALKLLFIMKANGEDVANYPWLSQRISMIPMAEKIVDIETPQEIVEMLRDTKYYPALQKAANEYGKDGKVEYFILALDIYLYSNLNKIIKGFQTGTDKTMASHLFGIEIDAINLLIALRLRGLGGDVDITNWLVPARYKLKDADLIAAFNAKNPSEVKQMITKYTDVISNGIKGFEETQSLHALETEFAKYILKENNRLFAGDRFNIGIPLAYLKLKENEVRNITSILHGKENGLDTASIEETLIMA